MPNYKLIIETNETILGVVPRADDWVEYSCLPSVKDGRKTPLSLATTFVPPHPFLVDMALEHAIKASSISDLYWKVIKFFGEYGVEYRR